MDILAVICIECVSYTSRSMYTLMLTKTQWTINLILPYLGRSSGIFYPWEVLYSRWSWSDFMWFFYGSSTNEYLDPDGGAFHGGKTVGPSSKWWKSSRMKKKWKMIVENTNAYRSKMVDSRRAPRYPDSLLLPLHELHLISCRDGEFTWETDVLYWTWQSLLLIIYIQRISYLYYICITLMRLIVYSLHYVNKYLLCSGSYINTMLFTLSI